jgi:glycosyltransferase involved in cell wall biosynthesis
MGTLEAKSYGIPIVAFDTPPARDYIRDGKDGYLIKLRWPFWTCRKDYPVNIRTPEFKEFLKRVDELALGKMVDKLKKIKK